MEGRRVRRAAAGRAGRVVAGLLLLSSCATGPGSGLPGAAAAAYVRGADLMVSSRWEEAVRSFDEAIRLQPQEQPSAHLYGMRYGYFPHRDRGIALYRLDRWDPAQASLEESLRQGATPEAARYLEMVKRREATIDLGRVFAGTWWDYYERGRLYSDRGLWPQAEGDFAAARARRGDEDRFARTYGVHFIEYFPVRELGVSLYQLGRYPEAVRVLEESVARLPTAKAAYYLNLARAALLRRSRVDPDPPRVRIDEPGDGLITNAAELEVRGAAESGNLVAAVRVNGQPIVLDEAVGRLPFAETVSLAAGENVVEVVARDLVDTQSRATVRVTMDPEGPVVEVEGLSRPGPGIVRLEGTVYDNVRLARLAVNGRWIALTGPLESRFTVDVPDSEPAIVIEAADVAGNVTRARLPRLPGRPSARGGPEIRPAVWAPVRPVVNHTAGLSIVMDDDLPAEVQEERLRVSWVVQTTVPLAAVKINGEPKTLRAADAAKPIRMFSHTVALREGDNLFTISATDRGGRETAATVKVVRRVAESLQIGRRLSVAVMPLQQKGRPSDLYQGAYDALENVLVNQRRFQIVNRIQLETVLKELKLSQTGLVDRAKAVEVGRIAAAEAMLVGTVNVTDKDVEMWAQLVSVETSKVLVNQDVYDPIRSGESFRNKVRELADKIRQNYPLVTGAVIEVANQRVAVDLGSQHKVAPDMKVIVFMEGAPLVHPQTKAVLGRRTDILGEGVINEVASQFSMAAVKGPALGVIQRHFTQGHPMRIITK
jgi:tetratricopeptide (TPR) repeat protein